MDFAPRTEGLTTWLGDGPGHLDDIDPKLASCSDYDLETLSLDLTPPGQQQFQTLELDSIADVSALSAADSSAGKQRAKPKDARKLAIGRETQKRFRDRQRARKKAVETDLVATKMELERLQLRERRLAARNALLEKVAALSETDAAAQAQVPVPCTIKANKTPFGGPVLTINLWDQQQQLDLPAVKRMPAAEFSRLWTAYMHKLGNILLEHSYTGADVEDQVVPILLESSSLLCCIMAYNVDTLKKVAVIRMDNGQPLESHQTSPDFYSDYLAMATLSKEQIDDLLYLRRVCIIKRGQLASERKATLAQMPAECFGEALMPVPAAISTLTMGTSLRANGSEDFRVWCAARCSSIHGVLTGTQHAMAQVHAYPALLSIDNLLDCVAAQHHDSSRQELLASAHTIDTSLHLVDLHAYVESLTESDCHGYKPFPKLHQHMPALSSTEAEAPKEQQNANHS